MSVNPCPKKNTAIVPGVIAGAGLVVYYLVYSGYTITVLQFLLLALLGALVAFASDHFMTLLPFIEGGTSVVTFNYTVFANVINLMQNLKDLTCMFALLTFSVYIGAMAGRILKDRHINLECMKVVIKPPKT